LQFIKQCEWVPLNLATVISYVGDKDGSNITSPRMRVLEAATRFPTIPTIKADSGNPTTFPQIVSLGLLAYLWKSAALLANVALLAAYGIV